MSVPPVRSPQKRMAGNAVADATSVERLTSRHSAPSAARVFSASAAKRTASLPIKRCASRLSAIDRKQCIPAVLLGDCIVVNARYPERFADSVVRRGANDEHDCSGHRRFSRPFSMPIQGIPFRGNISPAFTGISAAG